jgi:hypothetical protein
MAKNVVFDEDSAARIASAVRWVEQYSTAEEPPPDETETTEPRRIILGTFTGCWAKGATASVNFVADNGSSNQKDATNYFADVGGRGGTWRCVIALIGSEWVLISADPAGATERVEVVSAVENAGNMTLLSQINPTGTVVQSLSGTVVQSLSGTVVQSLSGTVVTGVSCVNGNLTVTTASLATLATSASLATLATSATLATLATSADLSAVIGYTNKTLRLSDFANVTTQNITLPKQEGCS